MAGRRDFLKRFGIGIAAAPIVAQVAEAALVAPAKVVPVPEPPKVEVPQPALHTTDDGLHFDTPFMYVHNATLSGNQALIGQLQGIFSEANFILREVSFTSTGLFAYRIQDGQGYYLSSGFLHSESGALLLTPEVKYPAGGRLWIDLEDLSGGVNCVQLIFKGVNRYRVSMPANYCITSTACMTFNAPQSFIDMHDTMRRLRS